MPISINNTTLTFNDSTTMTTAATVTSVATGNGLQGGTITTSGTLTLGNVGFSTVGSYMLARGAASAILSGGDTIAGSELIQTGFSYGEDNSTASAIIPNIASSSGTWRAMGLAYGGFNSGRIVALFVRIA